MQIQADRCAYDQTHRTYSAFASDFEMPPGRIPLAIVLVQSGRTFARFEMTGRDMQEGDIMGWNYVSRSAADSQTYKFLLIND